MFQFYFEAPCLINENTNWTKQLTFDNKLSSNIFTFVKRHLSYINN